MQWLDWQRWRHPAADLPPSAFRLPARWLALGGAAMVLVVLMIIWLVVALATPTPRGVSQHVLALATNTVTVSAAGGSGAVASPTTANGLPVDPQLTATMHPTVPKAPPTATPIPHPLPVPPNAPPPAHNPAPPPPPAIPTPTHVPPTATPLPPTATPIPPTATHCPAGSTGCGVSAPTPTATTGTPGVTPTSVATVMPTATPGPCQSGGAPYYTTPTATPTTATISQTISAAATRNGIPALLQDAIAWQESGWQQNIVACDGGIGLMQLMPATVTWLNAYYGVNDDPTTLDGNAGLGAGYIAYYANYYIGYLTTNDATYCSQQPGGVCSLATPWPGATDGATVQDIVISVYNEGATTMAQYGITNWSYVNDVLLWMQQQPWTTR